MAFSLGDVALQTSHIRQAELKSLYVTDDGGGMRLNSTARAALMNRLAGAAGGGGQADFTPQVSMPMQNSGPLPGPPPQTGPAISPAAQALALEQGVLGPASPRPTQCLLLKNMFDPSQ